MYFMDHPPNLIIPRVENRIWTSLTTTAVGGEAFAVSSAELDTSAAGIGSEAGVGATALTPHRLARRPPGRDGFPGALELESGVAAAAPLRNKKRRNIMAFDKRTRGNLVLPMWCFRIAPI